MEKIWLCPERARVRELIIIYILININDIYKFVLFTHKHEFDFFLVEGGIAWWRMYLVARQKAFVVSFLCCWVIGNFSQHDESTSLSTNINQILMYICIVSLYQISDSLQGYHEKRLLNSLLLNYNLLERPVANESDPLEVKFGLTLQQIIDVVSWNI